jgi:hypothetical protein
MVARVCAAVTIAAAVLSGIAPGQVKSTAPGKTLLIIGRAIDASGASIPDGIVKLKLSDSIDITPFASTKTDRDGKFAFPAVPPNRYELRIEAPGFNVFRKAIDAEDGKDINTGNLYLEVWRSCFTVEVGGPVPKYPTRNLAQFVIDKLDLTSFPSSIGPRRAEGKASFQDYGAFPRKVSEDEADLALKDESWWYRIAILKRTDSDIFACFEDRATYPARYHTQNVLWLLRPDSQSMLNAEISKIAFDDCPPFAR